jgi:hypothetical protein
MLQALLFTMLGLFVVVSLAGMLLGIWENVQAPEAAVRRAPTGAVLLDETPPPTSRTAPPRLRSEDIPPTAYEAHE